MSESLAPLPHDVWDTLSSDEQYRHYKTAIVLNNTLTAHLQGEAVLLSPPPISKQSVKVIRFLFDFYPAMTGYTNKGLVYTWQSELGQTTPMYKLSLTTQQAERLAAVIEKQLKPLIGG